MRTFITFLAALSLVLTPTLNGCSADYAGEKTSAGSIDPSEPEVRAPARYSALAAATAEPPSPVPSVPLGSATPATTAPTQPRQVIYSAAFRVVVADVAGTL